MELRAFFTSLITQTFSGYGRQYWWFLIRAFFLKPGLLAESVTMAVKGHHFFKITRNVLALEDFRQRVESFSRSVEAHESIFFSAAINRKLADISAYRDRIIADISGEYERLSDDFRVYAEESLARLQSKMDELVLMAGGAVPAG